MSQRRLRIFVSSPSDVFAERERLDRVIARLNGEFSGTVLEAIRWEHSYYTAAKTFQDQIPLPSQADLVICILWKRLGFELPPDYRRADGTTPTGTEYEFEDAIGAARQRGTPDVLVYRKAAPVLLAADHVEIEQAQFEALKRFWSRWFQTEAGHFTAGYQSFESTDAFERLVEAHIRQWLARQSVALSGISWPIEQRGSPYAGLLAFDADRAEVFFGRRHAVERARERLADAAQRGVPFLLILGTSGSGKSSLARAGLAPRLTQAGAVADVDVWRRCILRPSEGDTPVHALARALYRAEALPELAQGDSPSPADFAALLGAAPEAAARAVRLALGRAAAPVAEREKFDRPIEARLLLVVDQFEEALGEPTAREAFARALAALAGSGSVWIAATLRSDLYARFQASPLLSGLRDGGAQLDLLPPDGSGLAEIIAGPAAAAGLRFEQRADGVGLDEALLAAAAQPGALPLLQLALEALFEARDPATNVLTFAAYEALGGLAGVMERRAEATLAGLDAQAQAALPPVLRALVEVTSEGVVTSRSVPLDAAAPDPAGQRLVDAFVTARLLVADVRGGAVAVRTAHDALLLGWKRAAALIAADRDMLRARFRVEAAARRWVQEGRDPDFLLPPGRPLAEAVELAEHRADSLDADGAAFVAASREAEAARQDAAAAAARRELALEAAAERARAEAAHRVLRRTRLAAGSVLALAVVAVGVAVYANAERHEAQRQTAEAERNLGTALDAGSNLVEAVMGHLEDGGMSRSVARELLGKAELTFGGLGAGAGQGGPPALADARSRLAAGFSAVDLALCDSEGARSRAAEAVALAEDAARRAPSDLRALALVRSLTAQGRAAADDGDPAAALAALQRAEATASGRQGEAWAAAGQEIRREVAAARLRQGDWNGALTLAREDLAAHPDGTAALASAAADLRLAAAAAFGKGDFAAAEDAVQREAGLLERLEAAAPIDQEWPRARSINAQMRARVLEARGDLKGALGPARTAVDLARAVAGHDPENAEWQRDLVAASLRLVEVLARSGDAGATVPVLRPTLAAIRGLSGPAASSLVCKGDAARLHAMAGTALLLAGDGAGAASELQAGLGLLVAIAQARPQDAGRQMEVIRAELSLGNALELTKQPRRAARAYRAGIERARGFAAGQADPELRGIMVKLGLGLGGALSTRHDAAGALAAFGEVRDAGERWAQEQPDVPEWAHAVVQALLGTARAQLEAKRPDEQFAALSEAVRWAERLVAARPLQPEWRRDLIEARQGIAAAELVRGETDAGLEQYRSALALADGLVAEDPGNKSWKVNQAIALTLVGAAYNVSKQPDAAQGYFARAKSAWDAVRGGTN